MCKRLCDTLCLRYTKVGYCLVCCVHIRAKSLTHLNKGRVVIDCMTFIVKFTAKLLQNQVTMSLLTSALIHRRTDTVPLGTKLDVYDEGYSWVLHSLWPKIVTVADARVVIGGKHCSQHYSASLLNISGMSYGALSNNAILALNKWVVDARRLEDWSMHCLHL